MMNASSYQLADGIFVKDCASVDLHEGVNQSCTQRGQAVSAEYVASCVFFSLLITVMGCTGTQHSSLVGRLDLMNSGIASSCVGSMISDILRET